MKGHCPHGEFELERGCPQCIKENTAKNHKQLVRVRYFSETTGELSPREYTYFSEDTLKVNDIVVVPVRDTIGKAKVSVIDVSESEIEAFRDKVKIIPAGSLVQPIDTKINLCDTCNLYDQFPACTALLAEFGDGRGNDNIIKCDNYVGSESVGVPNRSVPNETEAVIRVDPGACLAPKHLPVEATEITLEPPLDLSVPSGSPGQMAIIKVGPEYDPAVLQLSEEARKLRDYAISRDIKAVADLKPATDDLSLISKLKKSLNELKAGYLKPIKAHIDSVNAAFASIIAPLDEADTSTRSKIIAYRQEQDRKAREVERINQLRMEAAEKEMKLKGEITESVNLIETPPAPPAHVRTEVGTLGTMKIRKYRIINFTLLPDQYKIENSVLLNKVVKAGIPEIPGVEIYEEEVLRVTTR